MKNNTFQNKDLQKNRLQKNITKNQLLQNDTQLIRVLDMEADRVFIIDCIKRTMPVWKDTESINEYPRFFANTTPTVLLPAPGIPINTTFFFK